MASLAFERVPKIIMVRSGVYQKNLFQNIERSDFLKVAVLVWLDLIGWVSWNHVQTSQTHGSIKVYIDFCTLLVSHVFAHLFGNLF